MKIYNSLSHLLENVNTLEQKKVKLYVCGITPYDTTHLGHAFLYVFFDAVSRYFQYKEFEVNYTQNVTDIDDDILKRSQKEKKDWKELGDFWTNKFLNDLKSLNVKMPTHYVKATDSISSIIHIIESLVQKNIAYERGGNVYFEVKKFKSYGDLSKLTTDQMIDVSKERGANPNDPLKKYPLDFILWQKSAQDEPFWVSPWSKGRPGWHIECSAMVNDYLGDQIDIHGGGGDLIYPHHESEIAQSESYTGKKPFVKYWMHVAMLKYKGEKMSKSLGNLVMVSDLLKKYSPNAIRYLLLSHHYREEWEFNMEELDYAEKEIERLQKNYGSNTVNDSEDIIEHDFNFKEALKNPSHKLLTVLGFVL